MKNLHLVPINVQDIVERLNTPNIRENELYNNQIRLEAIKEFCEIALKKLAYEKDNKRVKSWKSN